MIFKMVFDKMNIDKIRIMLKIQCVNTYLAAGYYKPCAGS